jgi:tryptophanyl-tRNA synthetase
MSKIFSGIRPSGKLHLGNYLGAIKNWIKLQDKSDQAIFAVVDYHGITTPYDPKMYQAQIMDVVLDYLAVGLDPQKALLIRQSKVPQHTELAWLFNTITPLSWLERLPTYKEQLDKFPKNRHAGLLSYPVLMAADILVYKSNLVPVGEDQLAHIDITNEIAKKFNHMFGDTFEPVKPHIVEGARIMSLQDPRSKMSKSGDEGIALTDTPDEIQGKIKSAVTDSGKDIKYDAKDKPAISNLIDIYHLLSGKEIKEIEKMYDGKTYTDFKKNLSDVIIGFLKPIQAKRKELENNIESVKKILTDSEEKAKTIAQDNINEIKTKMGLA